MIDYETIRKAISSGLQAYLGVPVIRGNQTAPAPSYPYATYNPTTIATANNGTWQEDADAKDRQLVRSIWSLSFLSSNDDESVMLATKARGWFAREGRAWLSERGVIVQSTTDITNRDNILTVEYERKNGFDVVFYVYDEAESLKKSTGYIEDAELVRKILI